MGEEYRVCAARAANHLATSGDIVANQTSEKNARKKYKVIIAPDLFLVYSYFV